jgi:hypothetical protein
VATALDTLLHRSQAVITSGASHTLQVTRAATAVLAVVTLVATRSPVPLLSGGALGARSKEAVLLDFISDAFDAAQLALTVANTSSTGEAVSDRSVAEVEAPIGFAAALASELALCRPGIHLLQDTLQSAVVCIIEVQSLQDPRLKTLTQQLRTVAAQLTGVLWQPEHVGRVVEDVVRCLDLKQWQSRGAAVKLLQTLWYRCACHPPAWSFGL